MKWKSSLTISLLYFDYLPRDDGKKVDAKNEDEDKKIWKMNFIFKFSVSKLGYMKIFMKIWEGKNLIHFLRHFWPSEAKMKMQMKNIGKMSLIYEFSISN